MSAKILHIWNDSLDWLEKNRIRIFHIENMVYFQQNNFPSSKAYATEVVSSHPTQVRCAPCNIM